jgi:hypothetical protein
MSEGAGHASSIAALVLRAAARLEAPKLHAGSSSVDEAGALVVSFDQRAMGKTSTAYALAAHCTARYVCIDGGGDHPTAADEEVVDAEVSGAASIEPQSGAAVAHLSAEPPPAGAFPCPSDQPQPVLASVAYTNIMLSDTTNKVSTTVPDASRTFLDA